MPEAMVNSEVMTDDELYALDRWIMEHVLGLPLPGPDVHGLPVSYCRTPDGMMLVVDAMCERGYRVHFEVTIYTAEPYTAIFTPTTTGGMFTRSSIGPLAVSAAARATIEAA